LVGEEGADKGLEVRAQEPNYGYEDEGEDHSHGPSLGGSDGMVFALHSWNDFLIVE
jgi:hypothetical protein